MATLGNLTATGEDGTAGFRAALKVTMPAGGGTVTKLSGYVRAAGVSTNTVKYGLYTNNSNQPGNLIVATSGLTETINESPQLLEGSVTPTFIAAGDYFIMVVLDAATADVDNHRTGTIASGTVWYESGIDFPSDGDTNWQTDNTFAEALFLTYTPATGDKTVNPTGLIASTGLGTPTVSIAGSPTVNPTGLSMSASLGTPSADIGANPTQTPAGLSMTSSLGVFDIEIDTQIQGTFGLSMSTALGAPTMVKGQQLSPTGLSATMSLGTPSASVQQDRTKNPTGLSFTASLGTPNVTVSAQNATLQVTGFRATFGLGRLVTPSHIPTTSTNQLSMHIGIGL